MELAEYLRREEVLESKRERKRERERETERGADRERESEKERERNVSVCLIFKEINIKEIIYT